MPINSVNINPLDGLPYDLMRMELLLPPAYKAEKLSEVEGLKVDPRWGTIYFPKEDGGKDVVRLPEVAKKVQSILLLDDQGDGDRRLTVEEIKAFYAKHDLEDPPQGWDGLLSEVQDNIDHFYKPLRAKLAHFDQEIKFIVLLKVLREYNEGLYQREKRMAEEPALVKGALNLVLSWETTNDIYRNWFGEQEIPTIDPQSEEKGLQVIRWGKNRETGNEEFIVKPSHYLFDWKYQKRNVKKYHEREGAIVKLEKVVAEGFKKAPGWALKADLKGALAELNSETVDLLKDELAATGLWDLVTSKDEGEFRRKAFEFAKTEVEDGNSRERHLYNLTGTRHNYYIARSLLYSLTRGRDKKTHPKPLPYEKEAKALLTEINGTGGNWTNLATAGIGQLWPGAEEVPLRDWSAENREIAGFQAAGTLVPYFIFHTGFEALRLLPYGGPRVLVRAVKAEDKAIQWPWKWKAPLKKVGGKWQWQRPWEKRDFSPMPWSWAKSWKNARKEGLEYYGYGNYGYQSRELREALEKGGTQWLGFAYHTDAFLLGLAEGSWKAKSLGWGLRAIKHGALGYFALGAAEGAAPMNTDRRAYYNRHLRLTVWPEER